MSLQQLAYLPVDRLAALGSGEALPKYCQGTALYVDITGFTPLAESLRQELGDRRGAEELTRRLNGIFNRLISIVHQFGGSVLGFSGDAITCWFDAARLPDPCHSAVSVAQAQQFALRSYKMPRLTGGRKLEAGIKVSLASGSARRFVVGDPQIQCFDVLAGTVLERMSAGEHFAQAGDILLDETTCQALGERIRLDRDRLVDPETGTVFTRLQSLSEAARPTPWPDLGRLDPGSPDQIAIWLPPAVGERLRAGQGEFLTELRPATALFTQFHGIDFENDPSAGSKLDSFICRAQAVIEKYEGTLLQITIGEKGSFLYTVFGAPIAHENDIERAARAALGLQKLPERLEFLASLRSGLASGNLRAGAYGGRERRTYGVLGDEVNLAARLMMRAQPGEILTSRRVQAALAEDFVLDPSAPIQVKGKAEALPVFVLNSERLRPAIQLQEPVYRLPMVGRAVEMKIIESKLELAQQGQGQVVALVSEAGLGKSRLVAEVVRLARRQGLRGYGGECHSFGTNISYLVWEPIWRAFFDVNVDQPLRRQQRMLDFAVEELAPERVDALPVLGAVLNLSLPENDFTAALNPEERKSTLEALLLDCVKAAAQDAAREESGILFVLEDLHWIDPLSYDLLERIARSIANLPVLILVAYRNPEMPRLQELRLEALPYFTTIALTELDEQAGLQLVQSKLAQLFPERSGRVQPGLMSELMRRSEGNPFFLEEILGYLHDRGIDPRQASSQEMQDLPASLHSLILSRIDQLGEAQRTTLKVASVIGRLFRYAWLHGFFPLEGESNSLREDLDLLSRFELTELEQSEPELVYIFKHVVTRDVAYASMPFSTRAVLHERLAAYLETLPENEKLLDLLAYHYDQSENTPKRLEYLRRAGEAAARNFANEAAIDYFSRAIDLTPDTALEGRCALLMERQAVFSRMGRSESVQEDLNALQSMAEQLSDPLLLAKVALRHADAAEQVSDYQHGLLWVERLLEWAQQANAPKLLAQGRSSLADIRWRQGDFTSAKEAAQSAFALASEIGDSATVRSSLLVLGMVMLDLGDFENGRHQLERALEIARQAGDRPGQAGPLNNLGVLFTRQGDYSEARRSLEQALIIAEEIGMRARVGMVLTNLAYLAINQGDYLSASNFLNRAIDISRETGDQFGDAVNDLNLGLVLLNQGQPQDGLAAFDRALWVAREIGAAWVEGYALNGEGLCKIHLNEAAAAITDFEQAIALRQAGGDVVLAMESQSGLAMALLAQGEVTAALDRIEPLLKHLETGDLNGAEEPLRIYLVLAQILAAAEDARADSFLSRAHAELQTRAARLDAVSQQSMLGNIPYHREIQVMWNAHQG